MSQLSLLEGAPRWTPKPDDLCWFAERGEQVSLLVKRVEGRKVYGWSRIGSRTLDARQVWPLSGGRRG